MNHFRAHVPRKYSTQTSMANSELLTIFRKHPVYIDINIKNEVLSQTNKLKLTIK